MKLNRIAEESTLTNAWCCKRNSTNKQSVLS